MSPGFTRVRPWHLPLVNGDLAEGPFLRCLDVTRHDNSILSVHKVQDHNASSFNGRRTAEKSSSCILLYCITRLCNHPSLVLLLCPEEGFDDDLLSALPFPSFPRMEFPCAVFLCAPWQDTLSPNSSALPSCEHTHALTTTPEQCRGSHVS